MAHKEIAGPADRKGTVELVSAHVVGKAVESQNKGAGLREDKAGHSGMNIHREGHPALCMHGKRTKRKHIEYYMYRTFHPQVHSNIVSVHHFR